jgi:ABC-type uncharacterized transport system fused permease/ATPase subunit
MPEVFGENRASTIASIWRLSVPYVRSDDRWAGRILLGAAIAIELPLVAIQVILNDGTVRVFIALLAARAFRLHVHCHVILKDRKHIAAEHEDYSLPQLRRLPEGANSALPR